MQSIPFSASLRNNELQEGKLVLEILWSDGTSLSASGTSPSAVFKSEAGISVSAKINGKSHLLSVRLEGGREVDFLSDKPPGFIYAI
jgi:hypothetical protein